VSEVSESPGAHGASSLVDALAAGRAGVELREHRSTRVRGADAREWLHDLVTTDVASLRPGETRPSLLLTPTGRIRAAFHVLCETEDAFLLVQRRTQPWTVADLLAPYVLSSAVELEDAGPRLLGVPGGVEPPAGAFHPSILGAGGGFDVDAGATPDGLEVVAADVAEVFRIRRGQPRFGLDLDAASLPAEAGLDTAPTTDRAKGCFLGQESVAKVANLGHPATAVLAVRGPRDLVGGEPVGGPGGLEGSVTSAAGTAGLARVPWAGRDRPLALGDGTPLEIAPPLPEAL
jgi:folate-binding protein YgfZ